jgi:hypothetical protein
VGNNVDGSFVMNYFPNPEFELGSNPAKTMFATRGYKTPIRTRGSVTAILDNKWRKLDVTSKEYMNTTQGKFTIAIDTSTSVAGTMSFQLIFEYVIEFRGASKQNVSYGAQLTGPATTMTPSGVNVTLSDALSSTPGSTEMYLITPALNVLSEFGIYRTAAFAKVFDATTIRLYESLEDVNEEDNIDVQGLPAFAAPYITYSPILLSN